jgi:cytochrome bd-type quinol oxidase subunit 2
MKQVFSKLAVLSVSLSTIIVLASGSVYAQNQDNEQQVNPNNAIQSGLCGGSGLSLDNSSCSNAALGNPQVALNTLITRVVNLFSVVVGIVAVVMIIVGGFRYIISGGDSSNVTDAKNTILYAIVGLIIVAISQFLVRFVLGQATGLGG